MKNTAAPQKQVFGNATIVNAKKVLKACYKIFVPGWEGGRTNGTMHSTCNSSAMHGDTGAFHQVLICTYAGFGSKFKKTN